jgi:drug/metabolite transporter (DMT)-like permease
MNTSPHHPPRTGVAFALVAAALFGASTPFAKLLLGEGVNPVPLAGLLYLGSGCGLALWWLAPSRRATGEAALKRADLPWLAGAIAFGGVIDPVVLMLGLAATSASTASLLLNLEGVLTTLVAWFVFRENFDRRIALGALAIVAGGVVRSWAGLPEADVPRTARGGRGVSSLGHRQLPDTAGVGGRSGAGRSHEGSGRRCS